MRTRTLAWAGAAIAVGFAAACFPEVTYQASTTSGGGAKSTSSSTAQASTTASSSSKSTTSDASTTTSVSTVSTGSGGTCSDPCTTANCPTKTTGCITNDPCDCDGDGYYLNTPTCAMEAQQMPTKYKGVDCYDCNGSAHKGQTAFFGVDRGDNSFDYSCSGSTPTEEYTAVSCGNPSSSMCIDGFFLSDPGCGNKGEFVACTFNPAVAVVGGQSCNQGMQVMQTQKCH